MTTTAWASLINPHVIHHMEYIRVPVLAIDVGRWMNNNTRPRPNGRDFAGGISHFRESKHMNFA